MKKHPETIEGPAYVPWEPLGQIEPDKLPEPSETYPGPWDDQGRGNGHVDLIDGQGRYFAHVYCWDGGEWAALYRKIRAAMQWALDNHKPLTKEQARFELKRLLDRHIDKLGDNPKPFETWAKLVDGLS